METKNTTTILKWPEHLFLLCGILILFCFGYTQAVAECMSGSKVKCFDCNSYDDYRCADPFNWTTPPPLKQCEGCCVKIVQGIDTPKHNIRRDCIQAIQINYFMVDQVCMSESNRRGFLCFCNDHQCNSATSIFKSSIITFIRTSLVNKQLSWLFTFLVLIFVLFS